MKIFPENKSRRLSWVYLAAAAVSGLMALRGLWDLATMLLFFSTPLLLPFMHGAVMPMEMPPLASFMLKHTRLFFGFFPLFWTSAFILALGLLRRAEWARRGAVAMLYLLVLAALLLIVYPWLVVPSPLFYGGVPLAPEFNAQVSSAAYLTRLLGICGGALCLWWALALDRGGAGAEFKEKPKEQL